MTIEVKHGVSPAAAAASCSCGCRKLSHESRGLLDRLVQQAAGDREEAAYRLEHAERLEATALRVAAGHDTDCSRCTGRGMVRVSRGGPEFVTCDQCEGTGVHNPDASPCTECESHEALCQAVTQFALVGKPLAGPLQHLCPDAVADGADPVFWAVELLNALTDLGAPDELVVLASGAIRARCTLTEWLAKGEATA